MTTNPDLAEQIEKLVRDHLAASRAAVASAVARAFAATNATEGHAIVTNRKRAKPAPRRAAEEVTAMAEKFYSALCRSPGETMATLAPQIGDSPRALHLAVAKLKRAGQVRAVGQRQFTRYFPMKTAAAAA